MLTEISWWGGFIFIWGAANFAILWKFSKNKFSKFFVFNIILFACCIFLLSLYFYELTNPMLITFYAVVLAATYPLIIISYFIEGDKEEVTIEDDSSYDVLGTIIYFGPFAITCVLASIKTYSLISMN